MAQQPISACSSAKMQLLQVRATFNVMCVFVPSFFRTISDHSLSYHPTHSLVVSYQSLTLSSTLMSQIYTSSANCISSSSLGGINRGYVRCVVQRLEWANFSHRERTSTHQTSTSLVRRISLCHISSSLLRCLSSHGICDLYTPGCLTGRSRKSFSPGSFRRGCDKGDRRPHT